MKKVISIFVLAIFMSFYAVSLFAHENCGMLRTSKTATHCGMEMSEMNCCGDAKECVTVVIHPVSSAPLNKVEVQKDITIDIIIDQTVSFVFNVEFLTIKHTNNLSPPDIYLGFQTPLLA